VKKLQFEDEGEIEQPLDEFTAALQQGLARRQALSDENVQRLYSRRALEQGFLECFELVGGVPRLAIWANDPKNYTEFLKLLMKFAPKEAERAAGSVINYVSSIPQSELNHPQPDQPVGMTFDGDSDDA
jgi:hypothetical protein